MEKSNIRDCFFIYLFIYFAERLASFRRSFWFQDLAISSHYGSLD